MHQTISGETHKKVNIINNKAINEYYENEKNIFLKISNNNSCLYDNFIVDDIAYNYLNNDNLNEIKKMIIYEYNNLEKIYPYLGNVFLFKFFNDTSLKIKKNSLLMRSDNYKKIINNLFFEEIKLIANLIFEKCSLEYSIFLENTKEKNIFLEKNKDFTFNINYDNQILEEKKEIIFKNYRFVLYDGYIQNISEIHHALELSSKENLPFVIFCKGASEEIFQTIKINNRMNKINVLLISINYDENNLNILNDIAILHESDTINTFNGKTIFQEVINNKKIGKELILIKDKIILKNVCNENQISLHRNFLKNRIINETNQENLKLLKNRIKQFNNKNLKLFLPEDYKRNGIFIRELDYFLKLIQFSNKELSFINMKNKNIFVPKILLKIVEDKISSLRKIINDIDKLILLKKEK